jgi:Tol biopolymer transport system component/predicted Ser/Thr protein kinase
VTDAARWRRVEQICGAALERDAGERASFVAAACGDDRALQREVESLLAHAQTAEGFLGAPIREVAAEVLGSYATVPAPGQMLGSYRIERLLGRGGMGSVFLAYDMTLHRHVALKVIEGLADGDAARSRLLREARTAAALSHPNICMIHEVREANGSAFIAMEYVEGRSLRDRLDEGALPFDEALRCGIQAADALSYAHDHGVIHRDLKAANVIVTTSGMLKIVDFGLARRDDAIVDEATTMESLVPAGSCAGTPYAMAPEQVRGERADARTDIWALGVLLYEMTSATQPFEAATLPELFSAILRDPPKRVALDLPTELHLIIERCLEKAPDRRFQLAGQVRIALDAIMAGTATSALDAKVRTMRWRLRTRRAVGLAAGAAVVAAAVYMLLWRGSDRGAANLPVTATFDRLTTQPGAELFPSLSPDGRWIVYTGDSAGNRDIYLQSVTGQRAINLTSDSPDDDEQPVFSPDGEQIAFRSSRDGGGIFVMGRTGEAVKRVTRDGFNPAWSPDGTQLAYTGRRTELRPENAEERSDLLIANVAGGEPRVVRVNPAMFPSWSPSGARIAFSGRSADERVEGGTNVFTVAAGGGEPVPVTSDRFLNWDAVWAPDGTHLYYVSNRGGTANIWRVRIDEASGQTRGDPEPITSPASYVTHLSLSRDGRHLAYAAVLESQNIYKLRLNPVTGDPVGEPLAVTTGSRFWSSPDPSPDGRWIVFYSAVQPEGDLYIAKADGSGVVRQLTSDGALDRVPRWSPDGVWIALFSDRSGRLETWRIRSDGSGLEQISHGGGEVVAWSPDGTRLAVTRGTPGPKQWVNPIIDTRRAVEEQTLATAPPPHAQFVSNSWSLDAQSIVGQNGYGTPGISTYSVPARTYTLLTDFGEWPVWLPDSRRVLFVSRGREFYVIDVATKATRKIFSVVRDTLGPPRLTRDGREAYFSRRVTDADVWVATLR